MAVAQQTFARFLFFRLLVGAALLVSHAPAFAAELKGQPKVGVEPFAMGRAYSAIADDWLALHYNPANLANVRGLDLKLLNGKLSGNEQIYNSYVELKDLDKSGTLSDQLNVLAGKQLLFEAEVASQITLRSFALGAIYDTRLQFGMVNLAFPTTTVTYTKDITLVGGFGVGIGRHRRRYIFSFGSAIKYIRRQGSTQEIDIDEIGGKRDALLNIFDQEGTGIGVTPAMTFQWPVSSRIEVSNSVVWHNLGKITFGRYDDDNRPAREEDNLTAGLGVRIPIGGRLNRRSARRFGQARGTHNLTFSFDFSHLNLKADEESTGKKLHAGVRLALPVIDLMGGVSQGQLSYGININAFLFSIQFASYSEELGSYTGQKRDRRYVLGIGSGFSIDRLSFDSRPTD